MPMTLAAAVLALSGVTVLPVSAERLDLTDALLATDERPMEEWPERGRVFRFIWLPPFPSMRIFSVRVQDVGQGPVVVARAIEWTYDKHLAVVRVRVESRLERRLSPTEWSELASMRESGFWKFRPEAYPQPSLDGAVWVLEGSADGERLRVVQHVPVASAFKATCQRMLSLFNLKLRTQELAVSAP